MRPSPLKKRRMFSPLSARRAMDSAVGGLTGLGVLFTVLRSVTFIPLPAGVGTCASIDDEYNNAIVFTGVWAILRVLVRALPIGMKQKVVAYASAKIQRDLAAAGISEDEILADFEVWRKTRRSGLAKP